ncbi:MAG TPA: hypothetical protein VFO77_16575 [Actinoplanes sp.]|nr:hypothetical protein [Actinoplanes sp.]
MTALARRWLPPARRWLILALAPIVLLSLIAAPSAPAGAAPKKDPTVADDGDDNAELGDLLESTGRRYSSLKNKYEKSKSLKLQKELQVSAAEAKRDALLPQAGQVASESYRNGNLSSVGILLNSGTSTQFLRRAIALNELNALNDKKLHKLNEAIDEVTRAKTELDNLVKAQKNALDGMAKAKESAERALALVGGNSLTRGFVDATSPEAAPAPRNRSGDFSPESCSVSDPTTGGCITPRTLHMYKQVKKAGFNRFVGCYRSGGPFEHPKGRACDWSLQRRGFSSASNSDMRRYGNDLMAFLVRNADRLGILYVIWYRKIWFPATGWKSYHGASSHTDHVHVSML